ncbi:MAG: LprI domain-containing protein [Oscillospiraceae bacterium]|jgi:uncharacterized protein YecT (DUF1311 family)
MKKNLPASILAAALMLIVLLPGCSILKHEESTPTAASVASSSAASSQSSSKPTSSEEEQISSDDTESATPVEPSDSQPGRVLEITTDNEEFNKKFAENPIDKAYIKESDEAISTVDMVTVSQKYTELWQQEVEHAWEELSAKLSTQTDAKAEELKAEQEQWENTKDAEIQKITSEALNAGGSLAEVNAISQVMDFYRSRAAQLYRELYDYDKNFSYAYSDE